MLSKRHKWISNAIAVALMLAFIVTVLPPAPTYAQEQTLTVSVDGVFVYQDPSTLSPPIAVLSVGATVTVLADAPQNGFNRVRLVDGSLGWAQVNVSGVPGGATAIAAVAGASAPSSVIVQAQGNVRIRDRASINGTRVGFIGWGEQAFLLANDASGDWIQINYGGITGWAASAWFVVIQGNAAAIGQGGAIPVVGGIPVATGTLVQSQGNLRIRDRASINGTRIGFVPWGAIAALLGVDASGDWIQVNYNGLIGWSASAWWTGVPSGTVATTTGITTAPAIGQGGGGVGDLILYNAPNENATAIMVIANGTPFNIVTPDPGSGFTLIEIPDGTTGFVMLPAGPVGPPVAPPPPVSSGGTTIVAPSTVNASGIFAQAVGNVRVRDRASINGARVAGIGWGAIVPVLGTNAERTWILVAAESAQGWVAVEWFTFVSGSLNQVPVVQ